jgi:RNA polymerase sigma factor (sigma-70 family)
MIPEDSGPAAQAAAGVARGNMPPTRWTLVCQAQGPTTVSAHEALSELCQMYWYPLYAYARRWGCDVQDAEDVTQGFFLTLLSKDYLASVSEEKGKLRSFLLKSMTNYMHSWRRNARAEKRGGGKRPISIDQAAAEQRYSLEPADELTPEIVFDRHWALTLMKHAGLRAKAEYREAGKDKLFEALEDTLSTGSAGEPYAEIAARLGMTKDSVKMAAYRLRKRFKRIMEEEIAHTVESRDDVRDEIRCLLSMFK